MPYPSEKSPQWSSSQNTAPDTSTAGLPTYAEATSSQARPMPAAEAKYRQYVRRWRERFGDVTDSFKSIQSKLTKRSAHQESSLPIAPESEFAAHQRRGQDCARLTAESIHNIAQCDGAQKRHLEMTTGQSVGGPPCNLSDLYDVALSPDTVCFDSDTSIAAFGPEDQVKATRLEEATSAATACAKSYLTELRSVYPEPEFEQQVMSRMIGQYSLLEDYVKRLIERVDDFKIDQSVYPEDFEGDIKAEY